MTSEGWTRDLARIECQRRHWHLEPTQWTDRRGRSHDLFGFIDGLAAPEEGEPATVAVQWTDSTNIAARVKKVQASPFLPFVRSLGWRILVWGFHPTKATLREVEI